MANPIKPKDNTFTLTFDKFYSGFSPLAFKNPLTEVGGGGHASVMTNVDIVNGDYATQGPGLSNLANGTQAGSVTELIKFILDKAVASNQTYAIGTSKLFQLSSTAVTNVSPFPHSITGCTDGQGIELLKGNLYYFYNKASGGDIGKYDFTTFTDNWGSTIPNGFSALQNAPHPSDKKEDILAFGNGRYCGVYFNNSNTLTVDKLDFGQDAEVDDVLYNAGYWYLAVNSGITGTNRTNGQIYLWDGSGIPTTLADETGVGMQRIGFLYRLNGIVYVAYQDLSSTGFIIGYINGKQITPLVRFTGTLPNFQQKTLYQNTILFISGSSLYSAGALVPELPFQLSQIASGGYSTVGAVAAPFGTPMVSSTDGGTNFKIAQFSGYDTNCSLKSIVIPVSAGKYKGYIDEVVVLTKTLGASARCDLTLETDQNSTVSSVQQIIGTGKRRHYFKTFGLKGIEDLRVALNWANGSTTNDCGIRKITVNGHFIEAA